MADTTRPRPTTLGGKIAAYLRTLNGMANLIAFVLCIITAILAVIYFLPELNVMGALGVLTIYLIVFIFFAGIAKMILKRVRPS
jgi:hypothetical protein